MSLQLSRTGPREHRRRVCSPHFTWPGCLHATPRHATCSCSLSVYPPSASSGISRPPSQERSSSQPVGGGSCEHEGMVAVPTAAMASSLLLRPRASSFRRALPSPPPSSRRALPATLRQAASTQQKQQLPALSARSEGERRPRPAGTRLYSLAPYPLLLAALLPGGKPWFLFSPRFVPCECVSARSVDSSELMALPFLRRRRSRLPSAEPVAAVFAPFVELVKTWDLPGWLVHWGHPGNMVRRLSSHLTFFKFPNKFGNHYNSLLLECCAFSEGV